MSIRTVLFGSCFAFWLVGCSGGPSPGSSAGEIDPSTVHRTLIHLNPDGTQSVRHVTVPRAQSVAELEGRLQRNEQTATAAAEGVGEAAQAFTVNQGPNSCADFDLWVFSVNELSQQENVFWETIGTYYHWNQEFCVSGGPGTVDLTTLDYSWDPFTSPTYWSDGTQNHIHSYVPGSCWLNEAHNGMFYNSGSGWSFNAGDPDTNANATVQAATSLIMYTSGC